VKGERIEVEKIGNDWAVEAGNQRSEIGVEWHRA
jgi:hypothetical protein